MRNFLTMALQRAGHNVISHSNGLEALSEMEKKEKNGFDLLLTDIVMPGMDGIELSQKAMRISPGLKIMFITGFAAVALGKRNPDHNNALVLSKPFHLKDLVNQIEEILAA